MILQTERLVLRPFRVSDLDDELAYATREVFWRYLPVPPLTPEKVADFVQSQVSAGHAETSDDWTFAAEYRSKVRVVGAFRIGKRSRQHRSADLGFGLSPDYWRMGLAGEAVAALMAFGFAAWELERIWATADAENEASWRVMEKCGMKREGVIRHHLLVRGAWRDSVLYAILAEEFARTQALKR